MRPLALGGAAPGPGAMSTVCFTLTRNFFVACWQVQRNEECELLEHLAYAYSSQGRFQRTIQLQNEITVIAKELGDKTREAKTLANLGTATVLPSFQAIMSPTSMQSWVTRVSRAGVTGSEGRLGKDRGPQLPSRRMS